MEPRHIRAGRPTARTRRAALGSLGLVLLASGCRLTAGASAFYPTETMQTRWGPLTKRDQMLIKYVRLANLWETPMADEAVQRGQSGRIREISKTIGYQHRYILEPVVRKVGAQLGVPLPTKPTLQQSAWQADIRSKSGHAYDLTYVKWLHYAHGIIFVLIGEVRGSTRNSVARSFAESANKFVQLHMQLLESTGLITTDSVPPPNCPCFIFP